MFVGESTKHEIIMADQNPSRSQPAGSGVPWGSAKRSCSSPSLRTDPYSLFHLTT